MQQEFAPERDTQPGSNLPPPPRSAATLRSPGSAAVTFLLCAVYFSLTLAVGRFAVHLLTSLRPALTIQLLEPLLDLLVLLAGFLLIARLRVPELRPFSAVGLVERPSASREVALGTAVGWAVGVALVLPGLILVRMHSALVLDGFHLGAAIASTLGLLLFVLIRQLLLCGLPFRSLAQATSPLFATVALAGLAALLTVATVHGDVAEVLFTAMAQLVFGMAAARTRAIWLGGALQFFWGFTVTLLFGLPSFLWPPAIGIVQSSMFGPRWLTGNIFGPEAALWAGVVVLAALIAVWRLTRDYAWHYTFDPIVGAGYSMHVPPPAEHALMEQAAATSATLVQIGGIPPTSAAPPSRMGGTDDL